ncbi:TRAP transporter small permease [Palleronia sediminis]|uniref:TRAP transporter small permease protein n=1 Tax=Palleronia sediminis TaxID=2547833 RepID=A0A4R6AJ21_9RHOB|nr:TRAP transporter small permease [Palleronia sediminis]
MALAGGAVLLAIVALTCASIAGRALAPLGLGAGPIRGIYDLTEIGLATAVFAFLPWCQFSRGHATVDLFAARIPAPANRALDWLFDLAMLGVAGVIAWRLALGMLDKARFGEVTQIAQIPVWWGYAAGLAGAMGFALIAAFCVLRSGRALLTGRTDE